LPRRHRLEQSVADGYGAEEQSGKDIWLFGGGVLFGSLLELGLVDRVSVAIIPTLIGGGVPLLPDVQRQAQLRLLEHQIYAKTGTVTLEYAVTQKQGRAKQRS
jgi:dihydrofolate reductase